MSSGSTLDRQGFALVTTLLVVTVVGVLITGSLFLSLANQRVSANDSTSTQAVNVALAGNAYWKAELISLYEFMIENFDLYKDDIQNHIASGDSITCGNYFAIGVDLDRDGTIDLPSNRQLPAISIPVGSQTGRAVVTFRVNGSAISLDSRGAISGARARVVEEFTVSNVDIWNNAVFAEVGAANATIKGRAEIRGAVHILGTTLTKNDVALDISGSFGLGNTYRGINPSLGVNPQEMRLTFPDPQDLCATLRVKRGYVKMGGSSQIGYDENSNPDPFLDKLRGIYTNDGISGGTEDSNVFSENGMTAAYDAGDSFVFPGLDDIRPDTGISWRQELRKNALILNRNGNGDRSGPNLSDPTTLLGLGKGDTYLSAGCITSPLFGINADGTIAGSTKKNNGNGANASGFALEHNKTPSFACIKYRVSGSSPSTLIDDIVTQVVWDGNANELYVGGSGGVVLFSGSDLLLTGGTSSGVEITYQGEGILFADGQLTGTGGNIDLEVDFLPAAGKAYTYTRTGNKVLSNRQNSYPATAILGLVADAQVNSTGAQKRFTTAIYAEESVNITKQTLVAGAIVTRTFDAGSQVPTVLYVPNLAERLSRLMPGAGGNGYAVSNVAYSRR